MPAPSLPSLQRGPSLGPHQAVHRPVVSRRGEDDHIQAVDKEIEVEDALDESIPLVLQESVQWLHQEHVMAILRGAKRSEAHSPARNHLTPHQPKALPASWSDHALSPRSSWGVIDLHQWALPLGLSAPLCTVNKR